MRWLWPLILLAGCGNSSSGSNDMSMPPDLATLSCPQTLDDYCTPSAGCVRDANTAVLLEPYCAVDGGTTALISAQSLGCTGGDDVVILQYSDTATTFFYSGGTLVAVFSSLPHSQELVCLAGPAHTVPPLGCGVPLNLCQP